MGFAGINAMAIPFTAALKPLTFRKGGMLFTEMMAGRGREDLSELRFQVLGTDALKPRDVEDLYRRAVRAWERAVEVWRTPFYGDFDVQPASRAAMVDGARDLLDRGYHREAATWVSAFHYFAQAALRNDAPQEYEQTFRRGYGELMEALGVDSIPGLQRKALAAERLVDGLMEMARGIVSRDATDPDAAARTAQRRRAGAEGGVA